MRNTAMEDKALIAGFVATQVGEALANYQVADTPLEQRRDIARPFRTEPGSKSLQQDSQFWADRFAEKRDGTPRPSEVSLEPAAVSEWVARVPGLFWRPGSATMRKLKP